MVNIEQTESNGGHKKHDPQRRPNKRKKDAVINILFALITEVALS